MRVHCKYILRKCPGDDLYKITIFLCVTVEGFGIYFCYFSKVYCPTFSTLKYENPTKNINYCHKKY